MRKHLEKILKRDNGSIMISVRNGNQYSIVVNNDGLEIPKTFDSLSLTNALTQFDKWMRGIPA